MLLYEFPSKREAAEMRKAHAIEVYKLKKKRLKLCLEFLLTIAIIVIGVLSGLNVGGVLLVIIGLYLLTMKVLMLHGAAGRGKMQCTTAVYDDRIENVQTSTFGLREYIVPFEDITSSRQTMMGGTELNLRDGNSAKCYEIKKENKTEIAIKNNSVVLNFPSSKAKLVVIRDYSEQIKYPKKNYIVIEDEDKEERDWVDRL